VIDMALLSVIRRWHFHRWSHLDPACHQLGQHAVAEIRRRLRLRGTGRSHARREWCAQGLPTLSEFASSLALEKRAAWGQTSCSDPQKLDRSELEFSAVFFRLGEGAESHEGIEVFGRAEGVHTEAGWWRYSESKSCTSRPSSSAGHHIYPASFIYMNGKWAKRRLHGHRFELTLKAMERQLNGYFHSRT